MQFTPSTGAGALDTLITLQRPQATRDPSWGSTQVTWVDIGQDWARVRELSADESTQQAQLVQLRSADVRIRYRTDVDATCRVLIGTRVLRIRGTTMFGRRQWLDLACEEADNQTAA